MRGATTAVSIVVEKEYARERHQLRAHGILDPAKRVNGRGSDLLSFGPRVVTNLRDRVTVRLTTTRRLRGAIDNRDKRVSGSGRSRVVNKTRSTRRECASTKVKKIRVKEVVFLRRLSFCGR